MTRGSPEAEMRDEAPDPAAAAATLAMARAPSDGDVAASRTARMAARRVTALARRDARARRRRGGPWLVVTLVFLGLALTVAGLGMSGRPIPLPVWMVAEAEARLNRALADAVGVPGAPTTALSVGGAVLVVDRADWTPRLLIEDLRLLRPGGATLVSVPQARLTLDPGMLLTGTFRLRDLRLIGARATLRRLPDGRFDIALGGGLPEVRVDSLPALFEAAEAAFLRPALAGLDRIEAEALSLTIEDAVAARTWQLGDGRVSLQNGATGLEAEMSLSLVGGGATPARATLTAVTERADASARVTVTVEGVTAADLVRQAPALAWLQLVEGTLSGQFATTFSAEGVRSLSGRIDLAPGALRPAAGAAAVPFERLALAFDHDPARDRIDLREIVVDSASLRLKASGHAYLPGISTGRTPDTALVQVAVQTLRVDPEGVFEAPATFVGGAIDLRLRRAPFSVEIGQATLIDGDRRLTAKGSIAADPAGWRVAVDVALDAIPHDRLLALWPVQLVPATRRWLASNLQAAQLFDLRAAVRLAPDAAPRVSVGYEFAGATLRVIKTLPPVEDAHGHATIEDNRYTLVVDRGQVVAPQGGSVDMAGSVLTVADIRRRPAQGDVGMRAEGPLTAVLSLLDQPPFRYMQRAGQRVDVGEGRARMQGTIRLPLVERAPAGSVIWQAAGEVEGFVSDRLVPGRRVEAPRLAITGDNAALTIAGDGTLDGVPFAATFRQALGPDAGPGRITGTVEVSQDTSDRLRLGLPGNLIEGRGQGEVTIDLPRRAAPSLRLTSNLAGVGLRLPDLGWSKPRGGTGVLTVEARLSEPARIDRLVLEAAGLSAAGSVTLRPGGALDLARFDRVRLGGWLDAQVDLRGRGANQPPSVALTGGSIDLRRLPEQGGSGGSGGVGRIGLALDRVTISEGIALTGLTGDLAMAGGADGRFTARINGKAEVTGELSPAKGGTAVRVLSSNAGAVLSAAGIFPDARGGTMDLRLNPREDGYSGRVRLADFRVRNTPVIAELLNAISVVGLLEQMDGNGLLFSDAEASFRITDSAIYVERASAVGASMGVSLDGRFDMTNRRLDMQGVISPIYLLNSVGSVLTRRGEGLFGFSYLLRGTADRPKVSVNPLSILTPGMFRDLFRAPAPSMGLRETARPQTPSGSTPPPAAAAEEAVPQASEPDKTGGGNR